MRINHLPMLSGWVLMAALVCGASGRVRPAESPTAPYETGNGGQRLFVRQGCYQCHGLAGQGSILSGPSLVPLRLDGAGFARYVRNPRGAMPPYTRHILSDADLGMIEAYVRSLPAPRPYSAIRLLASAVPASAQPPHTGADGGDGRPDFAQNCAACHGAAGEGGIAPSLKGEGGRRSVAAIAQLIMAPPPGMPKLYPAPLSRDAVNAVAAYVAKLPE